MGEKIYLRNDFRKCKSRKNDREKRAVIYLFLFNYLTDFNETKTEILLPSGSMDLSLKLVSKTINTIFYAM